MDWVTDLPPGGDRSYNSFLVVVDRLSKTPVFLPCHKDYTAMDTALLIWNRVVSWTERFTNIINDRDPKFTSALWTNLFRLFGTNLSFSTAYHPQTDGLAEKMIQDLEDMVRRICAYGLELKDCDVFSHDWCTLLPALLPQHSLGKDLVEIPPKASSFKGMLDKARKNAVRCIEDQFEYAKDKWEKSHANPELKLGNLVLVSTTGFNNIKGLKKLKDFLVGPFVIKALHGENAV
ncbi:hypothetical protein O181_003134 [Austropuccinia psidii MF-1]|uniref:Integrase catalytic domain-containing protein n=1 Tax=Austropuccinia psidii MF-1 TaxID=1389203 RepID=A0A9Q3GDJ2_9BASI|nr:hypothetical protein [Austropuccinia psidii MF-1]